MPGRMGGGTSLPDKTVVWPWLVPLAVLPLVGFGVHKLSAGTSCSWDYGAMGGACRVIILLSGAVGIVAAVLSLFAARGFANDEPRRGKILAVIAFVVVVLAVLAGKQFGDYIRHGRTDMDDEMCDWVRKELPACIDKVWGPSDGDIVRRSQPNCLADDREIEKYARCMKLTDCKEVIDCVSERR